MSVRLLADAGDHRPDGRPLLVVDVDEVVLAFVGPLAAFLERHGHRLVPRSFALTGNVTRIGGADAIGAEEVKRLIAAFFEAEVEAQPPVAGAVAALGRLGRICDTLFLTNVPAAQAERRAARLATLGFAAPLIANDGAKGPALARLAASARARGGAELPIVFVDDGPTHLASARAAVAGVRLVQFVADPVWFAMAPEVDGVWLRSRVWAEVEAAVDGLAAGDEDGGAIVAPGGAA